MLLLLCFLALYFLRSCGYIQHSRRLLQSSTTALTAASSFEDLAAAGVLPTWLLQNCAKLGFTSPTRVQREALPLLLSGADVVLQAQTGSGKTLAYCLPVLSRIDPSRAAIQAVVVVPSRELGLQVAAVMKQLAQGAPRRIMIMPLVEGSKNRRQQLWATAEPPHVVVGNPRALQRLVDMGRLRLNSVNLVVLDEVDACLGSPETRRELHRLLSQKLSSSYGSAEMQDIWEDTAGGGMQESLVYTDLSRDKDKNSNLQYRVSRQTIMCSATIPQRQHFAQACFRNGWTESIPELIHVDSGVLAPPQLKHQHVECDADRKCACLRYLMLKEIQEMASTPAAVDGAESAAGWSSGQPFKAIVFSDDRAPGVLEELRDACASALEAAVSTSPLPPPSNDEQRLKRVIALTPDSSLDERGEAIRAFRDGAASVLVCSGSVGARGLDVPDTTHVFLTALPETASEYLHRAGRAGRLGSSGKVVTLTSAGQGFVLQRFSNELGIEIKKRVVKGAVADVKGADVVQQQESEEADESKSTDEDEDEDADAGAGARGEQPISSLASPRSAIFRRRLDKKRM